MEDKKRETKTCPKCGHGNVKEITVCWECGHKFDEEPKPEKERKPLYPPVKSDDIPKPKRGRPKGSVDKEPRKRRPLTRDKAKTMVALMASEIPPQPEIAVYVVGLKGDAKHVPDADTLTRIISNGIDSNVSINTVKTIMKFPGDLENFLDNLDKK